MASCKLAAKQNSLGKDVRTDNLPANSPNPRQPSVSRVHQTKTSGLSYLTKLVHVPNKISPPESHLSKHRVETYTKGPGKRPKLSSSFSFLCRIVHLLCIWAHSERHQTHRCYFCANHTDLESVPSTPPAGIQD